MSFPEDKKISELTTEEAVQRALRVTKPTLVKWRRAFVRGNGPAMEALYGQAE